jgi:antitoxin ParD1/3/4
LAIKSRALRAPERRLKACVSLAYPLVAPSLADALETDRVEKPIRTIARVIIFHYVVDTLGDLNMSKGLVLNVRVSGALSEFVAANVSQAGDYENVSEYVRDLIRRDKERSEGEAFERLKAELKQAFASPESSFKNVTAADVISRNAAAQR